MLTEPTISSRLHAVCGAARHLYQLFLFADLCCDVVQSVLFDYLVQTNPNDRDDILSEYLKRRLLASPHALPNRATPRGAIYSLKTLRRLSARTLP